MVELSEVDLMKRVRRFAGPSLFSAAKLTAVPVEFLAALTANESGVWLVHDTIIPPRLEPKVLGDLSLVQTGARSHYGKVTTKMLTGATGDQLKEWATSWGLTQILGWHCLVWGVPVERLNQAELHYQYTSRVIAEFCESFHLDPRKDFEEMGRCWNGGEPNSLTVDPRYVENLLERIAIWKWMYDPEIPGAGQSVKGKS